MIANFINSDELNNAYSINFVYNYSERYEKGLRQRISSYSHKEFPLKLFNQMEQPHLAKTNPFFLLLKKVGWGLLLLGNKYFSIVCNFFILLFFFRKHKISILHVNNGGYPAAYSCYSAVFAAKLNKIPNIIYVVNNMADGYRSPYRWFDVFLDFFIKKWVTVFVTGSEHAGKQLKKVLQIPDKQHLTINNGIKLRQVVMSKDEFKAKYQIPTNRTMLSVIANLDIRKGHIYLLEAVSSILNNHYWADKLIFVIEGCGSEEKNLRSFVHKQNISEHVRFIGQVENVFDLISCSDVIVLPSIGFEDFPNIILEAMSLGKPVIATKVAGIPEQVVHNKTGLLVSPKSIVELKNAILYLAENPELLKKFSIAAKSRFDYLYNVKISVNKYISLYNSLTSNQSL